MWLANGEISEDLVTRRETIGEFGAFGEARRAEGRADYIVSGGTDLEPGTVYLDFGTNAGTALLDHWKLIAALMLGALLIALIPLPRSPPLAGRWVSRPGPPTRARPTPAGRRPARRHAISTLRAPGACCPATGPGGARAFADAGAALGSR